MPDDINYKVVKSINIKELIDLYVEGGWWTENQSERENLPILVKKSFCFMVAQTKAGKTIGMGRVISDSISDGYIQDVIVSKPYRNKGIGKQLVINLRDYCLEKGLTWVGLIAEPGTMGFYNKLGFNEMKDYVPMIFKKNDNYITTANFINYTK